MMNLAAGSRRFLVGAALALASAAANAATYQISLFEGTGAGSGSFTFTNPGTVSSTSTALTGLSTNASSAVGVRTFAPPGSLNVEVASVSFSDGKTPPNTITGNFVEGLTGSLSTTPVTGAFGCQSNQQCVLRITFSFTPNSTPSLASKTYKIEGVRVSGNQVVSTPVPSGTYAVSNTATVPEPDTLALAVLALMALALHQLHRRRLRSH